MRFVSHANRRWCPSSRSLIPPESACTLLLCCWESSDTTARPSGRSGTRLACSSYLTTLSHRLQSNVRDVVLLVARLLWGTKVSCWHLWWTCSVLLCSQAHKAWDAERPMSESEFLLCFSPQVCTVLRVLCVCAHAYGVFIVAVVIKLWLCAWLVVRFYIYCLAVIGYCQLVRRRTLASLVHPAQVY